MAFSQNQDLLPSYEECTSPSYEDSSPPSYEECIPPSYEEIVGQNLPVEYELTGTVMVLQRYNN